MLRKPLSLCPGSLRAVLGSSVPVRSLRSHAQRGILVDMSHGRGGHPGAELSVALLWHGISL